MFLQIFCRNGGKIHQADGLVFSAECFPDLQIFVKFAFEEGIFEGYVVDMGEEGGMAAVIRPVGVDHADLRDRRVSLFRAEIIAAETGVVLVHRERILFHEFRKPSFIEIDESVDRSDFGRDLIHGGERFRFSEIRFARFYGVDHVFFDRFQFILRHVAVKQIFFCRANDRAFFLRDQLDALRCGIGTLIELPGEVFYGKHGRAAIVRRFVCDIRLRLGEHRFHGIVEKRSFDPLRIVAV